MVIKKFLFFLIVNLAHRVQNFSPIPAVYCSIAFPGLPQQCDTHRPLSGNMAAGDWSPGFSWLYPGLLHSSGKLVRMFQLSAIAPLISY